MGCPKAYFSKAAQTPTHTTSTCLTPTQTQVSSANFPRPSPSKLTVFYSAVITRFKPDEAGREGAVQPMVDWRSCSGVGVRGSGTGADAPVYDTPKPARTDSPA
jgi:hypothetical protein